MFWKNHIRIYVCSINCELWNITAKGPHVPSKMFGDKKVPKKSDDIMNMITRKKT